jgi:hypothetical protein
MLFLNSWRVSSHIGRYDTSPPAIQKQQWHSREAQIELPLIECDCVSELLEYGRKTIHNDGSGFLEKGAPSFNAVSFWLLLLGLGWPCRATVQLKYLLFQNNGIAIHIYATRTHSQHVQVNLLLEVQKYYSLNRLHCKNLSKVSLFCSFATCQTKQMICYSNHF